MMSRKIPGRNIESAVYAIIRTGSMMINLTKPEPLWWLGVDRWLRGWNLPGEERAIMEEATSAEKNQEGNVAEYTRAAKEYQARMLTRFILGLFTRFSTHTYTI